MGTDLTTLDSRIGLTAILTIRKGGNLLNYQFAVGNNRMLLDSPVPAIEKELRDNRRYFS
jgi:hypothetical protein